ncbi:MAG: 16S rRNA (cytosine(1402)-N(4))-methyltransferase RsmH [bacterium]
MVHTTVLLNETVDGLNLKDEAVVFDGTLGGGGHSEKICQDWKGFVRVVATDMDLDAIKRASERLAKWACFVPVRSNYRFVKNVIADLKIPAIDGIILDLGLSSNQLDESGRGFSFRREEPLFMTFAENTKDVLTAEQVVNDWSEETLADIIYGFADERYAKRIARVICEDRDLAPLKTTADLVNSIAKAVPATYRHGKTHFATKTFQALRMAVNDELGALEQGIRDGFEALKPGGRIAIISFHSVEDRVVKQEFRKLVQEGKAKLINKKPIIPTKIEIKDNPRSRSAKLRIIEKLV